MAEIVAPVGDPFMDMRDHLAACGTGWGALVSLGQPPLGFGQGLFIGAKEARVRNRLAGAQGRKARQTHIDTNSQSACWQDERLTLNREADVPLACRCPAHRDRFDRPCDGTVQYHAYAADFGEGYQGVLHTEA